MKIRLGLAAIVGMLCLMVGVIAGGRAAISNPDGELAAGELATAGTDEHDHADGDHEHADGDHADGDHAHADGDHADHADGDHADGDHAHAAGTSHGHDSSDTSHAHDPSDPSHAHDPGDPSHPAHDPGDPSHPPHDPSDPSHPSHPTTPTLTYTTEQMDLLSATQQWIYPRFATTAAAEAAGYHSIGDSSTGFEHFVNGAYLGSSEILNPQTIESLVYQVGPGGSRTLVSGMYILPLGQTLNDVPAAWDTPQSPWHIHTNLCWSVSGGSFRVVGITDPANPNCPPGSIYFITPPMLHVWINEQPCGWFSDLEQVETGDCSAHPH